MMRRTPLIVLLLLCLGAAGCGRAGDREQATGVAERFLAAVAAGDASVACGLLADDTRKALEDEEQKSRREAIGAVRLEASQPAAVDLYLTNAEAVLDDGEHVFLSQTADGWRIAAAGCTTGEGPPADVPMKCELEA